MARQSGTQAGKGTKMDDTYSSMGPLSGDCSGFGFNATTIIALGFMAQRDHRSDGPECPEKCPWEFSDDQANRVSLLAGSCFYSCEFDDFSIAPHVNASDASIGKSITAYGGQRFGRSAFFGTDGSGVHSLG